MTSPCIWGILVAGGSGNRYNSQRSKLLEPLGGKPILQWSIETLLATATLSGIVIVYNPQWKTNYEAFLERSMPTIPIIFTPGGATRRDSVGQGLQSLPSEADIVLIHDAARPLVQPEKIKDALQPVIAGQALGTSLGIPAQNTLKQVIPGNTPWVDKTLQRDTIWQVHTPKVFQKDHLVEAHQAVPHEASINDDVELMERYYPGKNAVQMVLDDASNLKITTPRDLSLAEAWLQLRLAKAL